MSERQDTLWQYALVTQLSVPRATMVYTDEGSKKHPGGIGDWPALVSVLDALGTERWEAVSMHTHGIAPWVLLRRLRAQGG
jgi:hypothetical protein